MAQEPPVCQGLLINKGSSPHSVELLWTSDQPDAGSSTWHTTFTRGTSVPQVGFDPKIVATERPQNHALDRAATGIGLK